MEVDDIQTLGNKFPRRSGNSNGRVDPNRTSFGDEEAEDGEIRRQRNNTSGGGLKVGGGATLDFTAGVGGVGRLCGWPSSRIVRVSRASGGKDRHSKVLTSKGLRDRRVRLSVNTAIQFYDLQDRLGYDQPSKAVEWLLKAATSSISELPPITTPFPDTPKQFSDDKRSSGGGTVVEHAFDSADVEIEGGEEQVQALQQQQQQQGTLSKSACSSTSETSKGSGGLSLSRSESRLKARERARERAAKEKEEKSDNAFVVQQQSHHHHQKHHQNVSSIPQNATFTELLTSGFAGTNNVVNHHSNNSSPNGSGGGGVVHESNFFQKSPRNWSSMSMDYFGGATGTRSTHGFSGQMQLGNTMQQALPTHVSSPFFTVSGDTHQELHPFSLTPEHYVPVVTTTGGGNNNHSNEYNLNFSISSTNSSGVAGFNRGTLQSNSSTTCLIPQFQRFSSTDNGSLPSAFFLGTSPPPHAAVDNHHHQQQQQQQQQHHFLPTAFDAGLQLYYGAGTRHADQKGKGKG